MVISRHTLKRLPTIKKRTMTSMSNGQIHFSKQAASLLNAPCKLSFDFDAMICSYDEEDGFEIRTSVNGFYISSKPLTRFITEKFGNKKVKFEFSTTTIESIFKIDLV